MSFTTPVTCQLDAALRIEKKAAKSRGIFTISQSSKATVLTDQYGRVGYGRGLNAATAAGSAEAASAWYVRQS
jgi:hypothetical protein